MTVLMDASYQWSSRTADERFSSVQDLHNAALGYKEGSYYDEQVNVANFRVKPDVENDRLLLVNNDDEYSLTNWSFGQLCRDADAPASYLSKLPVSLAATNLNHGLEDSEKKTNMMLLKTQKQVDILRSMNSDRYDRIWNSDITRRLLEIEAEGIWRPAPAAFDGSRGLYLGDRSMFAFMVDNERRIFEKGPGGGLSRGFFLRNSEVGASAFAIMTFFYEYICGNHRVWGAQKIAEINIRHIGEANEKAFVGLEAELVRYAEASADEDEQRIEAMRTFKIGNNLDEVLDKVLSLRIVGLGKKMITNGFEVAKLHEDWYGDPRTVWGLAGGLTQIARDEPIADDRIALELASKRVMELAA